MFGSRRIAGRQGGSRSHRRGVCHRGQGAVRTCRRAGRTSQGDGPAAGREYATLVEALIAHSYRQGKDLRRFQLVRQIPAFDGGNSVDVIVDFLMPRDAKITRNVPPLIDEFAVQRASGADLALRFYQLVAVEGSMPGGGRNRIEIAVASIPALLAMKGFAVNNRDKNKDAYDIYSASGIIRTGSKLWPKRVGHCSPNRAPAKNTDTLPRSSAKWMGTGRPVSGILSRIPRFWVSEPGTSGSRMRSGKSLQGCARLGCAAESPAGGVRDAKSICRG